MYHITHDKRSRESSTWIVNALDALMDTMPYGQITITDICRKAKIGRTTFYRHYDDIGDILQKICDDKFDELLEFVLDYRRGGDEPPTLLRPFLRFWQINGHVLDLLYKANAVHVIQKSFKRMAQQAAMQQGDGVWSSYNSYHVAIRTAVMTAILSQWFKEGMQIPPDTLSDLITDGMQRSIEMNRLM